MKIDVVMRCRDEMPHTRRALSALARQRGVEARVLFFDCGSTDGSREEAQRAGAAVIDVDPAGYRPGRVLNEGMMASESEVVAFINADAVALDEGSLGRLIEPLISDPRLGATFARQEARASSSRWSRRDQERAFGAEAPGRTARGAFFSMAASAVSRGAWGVLPFDDGLRYSEDVDWTTRLGALGFGVAYCPSSRFEHSHEYSIEQHLRRRRGEGAAETEIFRLPRPSLWADLLRPFLGGVARDLTSGQLEALPYRAAQSAGFFAGRLERARRVH